MSLRMKKTTLKVQPIYHVRKASQLSWRMFTAVSHKIEAAEAK
jgi:hypothetical protein